MAKIEKISPEVRWQIATRAANSVHFAFSRAIQDTGNRELENAFAEIDHEFWQRAGRQQADLARKLGCPTGNAYEVAETFSTLATVLLGPELEGEVRRGEGDFAAIVTRSCPMNTLSREMETDLSQTCAYCQDYSKNAVESLNPDYELHYSQGMCTGDPVCEKVVRERRER
jgi:hypothetical protein